MSQTLGQNITVRRFGLSHCDKPSKFTRSECHNFGWSDNPSTLRRNVTVVKCHSRRFIGWTDSVGRDVAWSVVGGRIVNAPPEAVLYQTKPKQSGILLNRYRTERINAGKLMPTLVSSTSMPSYNSFIRTKFFYKCRKFFKLRKSAGNSGQNSERSVAFR